MAKRLYKSQNRVLFGVCGGVADFFNIDPTIIRLIMIVLIIAGFGAGLIVYIIAAVIMPERYIDDTEYYRNCNTNDRNEKQANGNSCGTEKPNSDSEFNSYFKKDSK